MGLLFQQEEVSWITIAEAAGFYYRNRIVTDSTVHNSKVELAEVESLPLIPLVLLSSILMGALF